MLPAKYQPNPPSGSGEEDFRRVFTIFGHGGHLEFRIKNHFSYFSFPHCLNAIYEIWLHLAQWFQRRSRLKVWTADDGGFPYYKLPWSLRLRGAKNWLMHPYIFSSTKFPLEISLITITVRVVHVSQ